MNFDDKVKQQYKGEKGERYHGTLNFVPDKAYPWVAKLRRNKITPFISEQNIILEYGNLSSWNVQTLGKLVEKMGFKVINGSVERFGYDRFSSVWADRLHIGEFGFRLLRRLIHLIKPGFEVFLVASKE